MSERNSAQRHSNATPDQRNFDTTDLNLAAFLRCRNFTIVDFKRSGTRTIFVFEEAAELRKAVLDFLNDGLVPARTFCNTLRDLRAVVQQR